jgi:hypothetical protein
MSVRVIDRRKRVAEKPRAACRRDIDTRNAAMRSSAVKLPPEQMALQSRHAARKRRDVRKRKAAQRDRIECDGVAGVTRLRNRVESDDLARQVKPEDLLAALAVVDVGLDGSGPDRGDRFERIAFAKEVRASLDRTDVCHEHVKLPETGFVEPLLQTRCGKRARAAESKRIAVVGNRTRLHARVGHVRRSPSKRRAHSEGARMSRLRFRGPQSREIAIEAHRDDTEHQPAARGGDDVLA